MISLPAHGIVDVPPARPVRPAAAWGSLGILLILSLLSTIDRQVISLLVDPIKRDLHLNDSEIGLLQGFAFALFYSMAAVPIGALVDRYPRKYIIYTGVTLWSLSAASCGLASRFATLFLARMGVGVGEAALSPSTVSLVGDMFPRDKVGTPMGVYVSSISLGAGLSLIISGLVVSIFAKQPTIDVPLIGAVASWQAVFLCTGLPGLLLSLLALLLPEPRRGDFATRSRRDTAEAGCITEYLAGHAGVVITTFTGFSLAALFFYAAGAWTPAYLSRHLGVSAAEIGSAWGATIAVSGAVGAVLGGILIDRFTHRGMRDACVTIPAIAALVAVPLMGAGYTLHDFKLVLLMLGLGTVMIGIVSAGSLTTVQRISPPRFRGRVSALFGLISMAVGASLGPLLVGALTDYVLRDPHQVGASLVVVTVVILPALSLALALARPRLRALPAY